MSDTPTTPETPETPAAPEAPKQETFSRDYVETLRQEAARYRNEKKTAADEARAETIKDYEGKLAEKDTAYSEMESAFGEAYTELLKLKAILREEIPAEDVLEVLELVQGNDAETIEASVKRVKSLLGKSPAKDRAIDPSQGKGNPIPLNGDKVTNMLKAAVGAR
ncbi:hypothetical protein [Mycobacterium intracellulare]|uniref:Scaffolding protein n=1 Tax=Mycobacterium intracellulare TaxID=1767 RepID=A0AAE4RAS8_MYCIT|nr:hypothetical protein [Mycobacterium intracellulare]MDV6975330.1 hypothetical protein [Mycobacterium intracellulare]MDV6980394.1 hypothetical protein [Mycobacterium intracellulare]MDV7010823.1 hypothetical protein [Mycobacterium intracellulare]MDV7025729.1 hypothetical protein [Mycobacterium intracellulare]